MQVLMLSWEYPPNVVGGLGRHVAELTPFLVRQGINVHVVTPTAQVNNALVTVENGVTVHRVPAPMMSVETSDIYEKAVAVNKILETYGRELTPIYGRYDLIHAHDWLTGFAGIALARAWKRPLVATIHATERGRNRGLLSNELQLAIDQAERNLIEASEQIIVCSHFMFNEIQYLFQIPAAKLEVIPNAVDLVDVQNGHGPSEVAALRAKFADPDDLIVFTISRLVYEKGVQQLVQAAPQILAQCPQARILIAGRGPEAENLKWQAENLGVASRVNFIGFIPDETRNMLLKGAACAVFPSLYEPFGIVALEAMALNCPLVVSDVGGFSEMVKHEETGVTVYPGDAASVAWGVLHMLKHPEWARVYAARARQSIDLYFNWSRIARLTTSLYERILLPQASPQADVQSI